LFLACLHLNSGTNLPECEDHSWFKVQAVPVFRFNCCKMFSRAPRSALTPGCRPLNLVILSQIHQLLISSFIISYVSYMFILEFVRVFIYSSVQSFTTVLFTYSFITIHVFIHASSDPSIRTFYVYIRRPGKQTPEVAVMRYSFRLLMAIVKF
jgi:hypothetical protein